MEPSVALRAAPSGSPDIMDTIAVGLADRPYDILIGRGLLAELPNLLTERTPADRYAIVSDSHVAELYGRPTLDRLRDAGLAASLVTFPAGEWNKTRESWAAVTDELLAAGFGRDSAIVGLGGGVTCDLAGFVAATYLRGIPCVHVPTTLLAMLDAAIGGKTGVDTPAGKNLVGAFHQPALVAIDVATLGSLARQQIAAGAAEALKHGVIAAADHFDEVEGHATAVLACDLDILHPLVRRSAEIKARIVAADEREAGLRAVLNYGHTIAHAIEATSGYEILHGEAVGIGMLYEARLAERIGLAAGLSARIDQALVRYDLPRERPERSGSDLLAVMRRDKKARAQTVRFALPTAIGQMGRGSGGEYTVAIEERVILEVLG
jgi:3-dehydroquinate synthase